MTHVRKISIALVLVLFTLSAWANRPALADEIRIHTVQPGETLFRIGVQYGISWTEIFAANNLSSTVIYVGQQLVIPGGPVPGSPADANTQDTTTYRVQRGDILSLIAQRYHTTSDVLVALNGLAHPNLIYPGQQLIVPITSPLTPAGPAPIAPPPSGNAANKRIVVDISDQRMYVYENGALLWTFVVSTGLPGRETAIGNFRIQSKIPNAYGSTWNIWMPNWLGIYWAGPLENGIHALPIQPDGSTLWAGYLGRPISYGCVVLSLADSQTLYNWAEIGVPVDIQY